MSVGESIVEDLNSGFDQSKATIHVGLMEDDTLIQVYSTGIRHIKTLEPSTIWQIGGK